MERTGQVREECSSSSTSKKKKVMWVARHRLWLSGRIKHPPPTLTAPNPIPTSPAARRLASLLFFLPTVRFFDSAATAQPCPPACPASAALLPSTHALYGVASAHLHSKHARDPLPTVASQGVLETIHVSSALALQSFGQLSVFHRLAF